jgi:hypothetical protein
MPPGCISEGSGVGNLHQKLWNQNRVDLNEEELNDLVLPSRNPTEFA